MLNFRDKLPGGKDIIKNEKIKTVKYFIKNNKIFNLKKNYNSIINTIGHIIYYIIILL